MRIEEDSRAKRDKTREDKRRAAWWLWGGVAALVVMFAAGFLRTGVLVHGDTARQILEDIEIAAVVVGIGSFFRSAILYERTKLPDKG